MCKLDALARVKLSKLLDVVSNRPDWRELATRLKLGISMRGLEMQKSPTKALLDNYEVRGVKKGNLILYFKFT
jgi:Death domain